MGLGDYAGGGGRFDGQVQMPGGKIGEFEIDVLKYRAEAEYKLGDYGAAAHTYDVLLEVDKEQPEYFYRSALTKALSGDAQGALDHYLEGVELEKKKANREWFRAAGCFGGSGRGVYGCRLYGGGRFPL